MPAPGEGLQPAGSVSGSALGRVSARVVVAKLTPVHGEGPGWLQPMGQHWGAALGHACTSW